MCNQSFESLWTDIAFDARLNIIEVRNQCSRLLFGIPAGEALYGKKLSDLSGSHYLSNSRQIANIEENLRRGLREKRNVYFEYTSALPDGQLVYVTAHALYGKEGAVSLHAAEINREDMNRRQVREEAAFPDKEFYSMLRIIHEHMPVGLEMYDKEGRLIFINPREMEVMGIKDEKDVMGLNLFENPNISRELKDRLRRGESVRFSADYDFTRAGEEYFQTSRSDIRHFDVIVSLIRDTAGEIDKYLMIIQDSTERVMLQKKYETLYNQMETVMNSLPVGVELYANDGTLTYLNDTDCRIFGAEREALLANPVNLHMNPILPEEIKSAVRNNRKVHMNFPYNFDTVAEKGYYSTSRSGNIVKQIDCNGRPVINAAGGVENYIFIVDDVTESVRQHEMLRQSKKKSELAMKAADIMLWEFDTRTRVFISENDPLNGYDAAKPLTINDYTQAIHPEERPVVFDILGEMLSGKDRSFTFDTRIKFPKNLEWQYCTISGSPYEKDPDGKVVKYVGTRKNNTELEKKKLLQEKVLNSIPLPVYIKDVEDAFRYVFCNEESKRMFGMQEQHTAYDIVDEEQVEKLQQTDMEVWNTGKPYFGRERLVLKDGRAYDMVIRKSLIYDNGKRLLLNVSWDQSLQNELDRRTRVLSISMDALNAYMWFYDPATKRLSYGEGFDKMGHEARSINTIDKFADRVHSADRAAFLDAFYGVQAQDNGDFSVEYRIDLDGKGKYQWWERRGIVETSVRNNMPYKYMFGMDINIDSHKKTELTLLKHREEMSSLIRQNELVLNNTNSGLAYVTPDYMVQWENVSKSAAGLPHEAYKTGEICYKSAYNRTAPCENCVLQRALKSGQMEKMKFNLPGKHTIEVLATPVFNERDNSRMDGVVIRVDDITERERMISELRQAKMLAEQSDNLKSAFLANMSHEIRTPLNAIVGFSGLLVNTQDLEEREEYMNIINSNNDLLLKLINDILDLSKIESGSVELKYEEFDLSEYFNGMASSMKQRITNPEVKLNPVNPYAKCMVNLDKNRVAQLLTNYVTNSIKYTPKGCIEMGYEQRKEGIYLYVRDSGIGIPEDKKAKVFHRFEKLDEFAQGTGLGLSICKAIAESMGGTVGFESVYGKGSLFWALLPVHPISE